MAWSRPALGHTENVVRPSRERVNSIRDLTSHRSCPVYRKMGSWLVCFLFALALGPCSLPCPVRHPTSHGMDAATSILESSCNLRHLQTCHGISGLEYLHRKKRYGDLSCLDPLQHGPSLVCPIEGPVRGKLASYDYCTVERERKKKLRGVGGITSPWLKRSPLARGAHLALSGARPGASDGSITREQR
ncbi:hypothetical protein B0J15DRAFT_163575 [Fusarium solani]|uniref:Uncharacterized protein n=1 Tax=Fusarium solani TaxID=169388 RepID=A0A9P9RB18_FUSSL|nr:uncharacterized protein B0J15DRAFT_163575 [Fusarium solani]KAH7271958.1 hypothetical protein B0J15DRAFT_163575 [Fusarium solani]